MLQDGFKRSGRLIFSFLSIACLVLVSHGALAAPVEGCDPLVLAAMEAKAKARVAYDVAVIEQLTDKPDSVLALTCFNQAAGVSAKKGGEIFSGDLTPDLGPIIEPALKDTYLNFAGAAGFDSGKVDYTSTALSDTFKCPEMDDLWQYTLSQATETDVPYPDFDQLTSDTPPPGGGADFDKSWNASAAQGDFAALKAANAALTPPSIPDFSGAKSSCEVMVAAGIAAGPCP